MIKITITGDLCPINKTETLVKNKQYRDIFHDVQPILQNSDLSVTNLECPLTQHENPISKTGPALKAKPETIEVLKIGNFKLATLANNHIMDLGQKGLFDTMQILTENKISYVGAGKSLTESRKPFVTNIQNKSIAILNFAENEFSTTHGDCPGTNPLSLIQNFNDIKKAKSANDIVILIYHGGNEEYNLPSPRIKETFRFFVDAGADAVISHHTHRYSGYEIYKNAPIFYGVGNFLFDDKQNKGFEWQQGLAITLVFSEQKTSFEINPISHYDGNVDGVRLLNGIEKKQVLDKISYLNSIIADEDLLNTNFLDFVKLKEKQYQHFIEPHSNCILHGLMGRGYIPSLLSKYKRKLYLNLIRCESHRDVLIKILENENRNS